ETWRDATSPYGYASPIAMPGTPADVLAQLMSDFVQTCADSNLVSGFFRLHPTLEMPTPVFERFGSVVFHGDTVYVDLRKPIADITKGYRTNHTVGIRKLVRDGFTSVIDEWHLLPAFQAAYKQT